MSHTSTTYSDPLQAAVVHALSENLASDVPAESVDLWPAVTARIGQREAWMKDLLAHDIPSGSVDLWPAIHGQVLRRRAAMARHLEIEVPADSVDLWPKLAPILEKHAQRERGSAVGRRLLPQSSGPLRVRLALVAATFLVALMLVQPTVAQTIFQEFQRFALFVTNRPDVDAPESVAGDPALQITPQLGAGGLGVDTRTAMVPLGDAAAQIGFTVPQITEPPAGFALQGAWVSGPHGVRVFYRPSPNASAGVFLDVRDGRGPGGYAVYPGKTRETTVSGLPATYGWADLEATFGQHWITWSDGRFIYLLSTYGIPIDQPAMERMAESIQ